jgi:hypothetical protein
METTQANFSDLPKHELLRALGQTTVQAGLFMIAVSSVMKHLGNLPDVPLNSTVFTESPSQHQPTNNSRGYFD